jgi:hypothetical protein
MDENASRVTRISVRKEECRHSSEGRPCSSSLGICLSLKTMPRSNVDMERTDNSKSKIKEGDGHNNYVDRRLQQNYPHPISIALAITINPSLPIQPNIHLHPPHNKRNGYNPPPTGPVRNIRHATKLR